MPEEERRISPGVAIAVGLGLVTAAGVGIGAAYALTREKKPADPPPGLANLYGKVTDASTGEPVADVDVRLDGLEAYTEADGYYEFLDVAPGSYYLSAVKEDYVSRSQEVDLAEGNNKLDLSLVPVAVPPEEEPHLVDFHIPAVAEGTPYKVELTVYLPEPWLYGGQEVDPYYTVVVTVPHPDPFAWTDFIIGQLDFVPGYDGLLISDSATIEQVNENKFRIKAEFGLSGWLPAGTYPLSGYIMAARALTATQYTIPQVGYPMDFAGAVLVII